MIEIKEVRASDEIMSLAELAREIWEEHFPPIIGMDQVQYMLEKFQSAPAISEQIKGGYRYFRSFTDGEPCGYFGICPHEDCMYLSKFYMKAQYRRRGIGRVMMERVAEEARNAGFNKIQLNVNKYNFALEVYKHLGFVIVRDEVIPMEDGFVMDDFVMEKSV